MSKLLFLIVLLLSAFLSTAVQANGYLNDLMLKKSSAKDLDPSLCLKEAICEPIQNTTCFGTVLPYSFTSLALAEDSVSQYEVQENLALWQGLRTVPRCWAVVQPLLCAVYLPKCENGLLSLPSQEMCRITRGPCRAVTARHEWPAFLRCENKKIYPPGCRNALQEVKFNTSFKCIPPLVETDLSDSWYDGIEGCGIQCRNPLYTNEEHESTHRLIKYVASICCAVNLFAVLTFSITWKAKNQYPEIIIFYINACLLLISCLWLMQFFSGARDSIVCLHDGTSRRKHPRFGLHLCSITFLLQRLFPFLPWTALLAYGTE